MAGSRRGNRWWYKLSHIFGLLEAMFLWAVLSILGRLTLCPWPLSLENERSCRRWTFSTRSLSSTRGVGSTHVRNILGGLTLGKLGVFLVGFCFYFLNYPSGSGILLELPHLPKCVLEILGMYATLWDPSSWSQSVTGPSVAYQDIIKPREHRVSPHL